MSDVKINVTRADLVTAFNAYIHDLLVVDGQRKVSIIEDRAEAAINVASQLGQRDGQKPSDANPLHLPKLPGESLMDDCLDVPSAELGEVVSADLRQAADGSLLGDDSETSEPKKGIGQWIRRNGVLLVIWLVVIVIEYVLGRVIMARLFGVDNATGTVLAVGIPTAIAIVALVAAQSLFRQKPGLAARAIWPTALGGGIGAFCWVVMAGLAFSGIVAPPSGIEEPSVSFRVVRMTVYVALILSINLAVFSAHLGDLVRDDRRRTVAGHERSRRLTPAAIASANQHHLRKHTDLYQTLLATRRSIINAYIDGARETMPSTVATGWRGERMLADPPPPEWLTRLKAYLEPPA